MGERTVQLKIGQRRYAISSDDTYLPQMQPGALPFLKNIAKALTFQDGFEPGLVRLFESLVGPEDLVVDVGANIGCTTILFGQLAKRVVSFEPSPTTFRFLEKNVRASGIRNIELKNLALGSQEGQSTITFSPSNRAGGFVSDQISAGTGHVTEAIAIRRLDDVLDHSDTVDFLKLDVEGFEKHVLDGAHRVIRESRPVVVLELNHWCLNAFQRTSIPDFFDYLRAAFPILYAIDRTTITSLNDEDGRYHVMYNHILHQRYPNLLAAFDMQKLETFLRTFREGRIG